MFPGPTARGCATTLACSNANQPPAAARDAALFRARRDPRYFFERVLGWTPWSKQVEIAEALLDAIEGRGLRRLAVRSGNGVGKTALAARLMLWVLSCYPDSCVITTAPTARQVDELLWREARAAYHGSLLPLGGRFFDGRSRWDLAPLRYALGFTSEKSRPERFQGFHAGLILFIVDEASAVPAPIWEAIKGSSLSGTALILAFSNPSRLTGEFYQAFHAKQHLWRKFHISAFDTPTSPGNPPK